jgi:lipopolysaccharide/colanic/teichoic acid biosynthesis glycosyltransferase
MAKRIFDFLASLFGIALLLPFFLLISVWIIIDSGFPVFFLQSRVGKGGREFKLIKFRSMKKASEKAGQLTVGNADPRITPSGRFLRKYKLDELPQLFNVLAGDMSLVGPRPEVRKYTELYSEDQKKILNVKPGITDYASIEYSNEKELLGKAGNPEQFYIEVIMPAKLELNKKYLENPGLGSDLKIIWLTLKKILS